MNVKLEEIWSAPCWFYRRLLIATRALSDATSKVVLEQGTPVTHLLQLRLRVDGSPFIFRLLGILLVDPREQELKSERAEHTSSRKGQGSTEACGILGRLFLLVDEGAYNATQITNTDHGGNTSIC
jgi:hypothetical protein